MFLEIQIVPWLYLIIAGLLEIGWAIGLKYSAGFTRLLPSALTFAAMIASFYFLGRAAKDLPIGTAYAVWTGIGVAGTAILGMVLLGETASPSRIACLVLVLAGIAGLKLTSAG